jgi:hypothetical protein
VWRYIGDGELGTLKYLRRNSLWLGGRDSNPDKRSQSPLSYR